MRGGYDTVPELVEEDVMPSLPSCTKGALLIAILLLSACATVSESDLYQPNFGRWSPAHFDASVDPDPQAIANGLYASPCYRCSSQSQLNWSGWSP
jgi:hypothetical protein